MIYKELIDLGFKHITDSCQVWKNEYGYEYFRVEYWFNNTHYAEWNVQKQTVEAIKINKEHDILERWEIPDLQTLKNIIRIFGKNNK